LPLDDCFIALKDKIPLIVANKQKLYLFVGIDRASKVF